MNRKNCEAQNEELKQKLFLHIFDILLEQGLLSTEECYRLKRAIHCYNK